MSACLYFRFYDKIFTLIMIGSLFWVKNFFALLPPPYYLNYIFLKGFPMKRKLLTFMLCIICLLSACGKNLSDNADTTATDAFQTIGDTTGSGTDGNANSPANTSANSSGELTMEETMIANSLLAAGNNYRLKDVIKRARAGEDVTLGFIGGSITEGYNAGTDKIYAKLVYDFFCENYGTGDNVHYVNAGLSGTPSSLGLLRSDRDLFAYEPDLIFIEFAVNDGSSTIDNTGYESLVYKALSQENAPAVILLMSVIESGYTCQDSMNLVGFQYDLTRISVKNAIWDYIESGDISWDDWSNDESHPNEWGHAMYASFIIDYLKAADAAETDSEYVLEPHFIKGFDHTSLMMIDRSLNTDAIAIDSLGSFTATGDLTSFNNGWKYTGEDTSNTAFTFTYNGEALYLVYKDTANAAYGTAEVYIDGEYVTSLYANSSDGWNNPVIECIVREKESTTHTVEVRMNEESMKKCFSILAVGVVK